MGSKLDPTPTQTLWLGCDFSFSDLRVSACRWPAMDFTSGDSSAVFLLECGQTDREPAE